MEQHEEPFNEGSRLSEEGSSKLEDMKKITQRRHKLEASLKDMNMRKDEVGICNLGNNTRSETETKRTGE